MRQMPDSKLRQQVENFYNSLDAEKGKKLIIFENSAHLPIIEKKKYQDLLVNVVLKESQHKYSGAQVPDRHV